MSSGKPLAVGQVIGSSPRLSAKKKPIHLDGFSFLVWYSDIGLEEGGDGIAVVKKCPANTFLARGRVHGSTDAACRAVDDDP